MVIYLFSRWIETLDGCSGGICLFENLREIEINDAIFKLSTISTHAYVYRGDAADRNVFVFYFVDFLYFNDVFNFISRNEMIDFQNSQFNIVASCRLESNWLNQDVCLCVCLTVCTHMNARTRIYLKTLCGMLYAYVNYIVTVKFDQSMYFTLFHESQRQQPTASFPALME